MLSKKIKCGVIGNPVEHSLSPGIHTQFAKQTNLSLDYQKYLLDKNQLESFISVFFEDGGKGLNVTLPFKQQVIDIADELSDAASICRAVNTLSVAVDGKIRGDTTDGAGLILDLQRLGFEYANKNILVIGAGGASLSVIHALLENDAKVTLHNRSLEKISAVVSQLSNVGVVIPFDADVNDKDNSKTEFDGVICAVSQFNHLLLEPVIPFVKNDAFIYDLNYAARAAETLDYFQHIGMARTSDGYGMLVGQAAKSFEIWHGVLPDIVSCLKRNKTNQD